MLTTLLVSSIFSISSFFPTPTDFKNELHQLEQEIISPQKLPIIPKTPELEFFKEGIASWYGRPFHGRLTASGKRYNMYEMTAAFPEGRGVRKYFGKKYKVTCLDTKKSVVVTITDTGAFGRLYNRAIDLSYGAAKQLGIVDKGLAKVKIERIKS